MTKIYGKTMKEWDVDFKLGKIENSLNAMQISSGSSDDLNEVYRRSVEQMNSIESKLDLLIKMQSNEVPANISYGPTPTFTFDEISKTKYNLIKKEDNMNINLSTGGIVHNAADIPYITTDGIMVGKSDIDTLDEIKINNKLKEDNVFASKKKPRSIHAWDYIFADSGDGTIKGRFGSLYQMVSVICFRNIKAKEATVIVNENNSGFIGYVYSLPNFGHNRKNETPDRTFIGGIKEPSADSNYHSDFHLYESSIQPENEIAIYIGEEKTIIRIFNSPFFTDNLSIN